MSKEYIDFELQMVEDIDISVKDYIHSGAGGVLVFSSVDEFPAVGSKSFLYIIKNYGTFYWDTEENKYNPIPLYTI